MQYSDNGWHHVIFSVVIVRWNIVIGDFPKPIPMSLTNESQIAVAAGQGRQWWAGCHGNDG